MWSARHRISQPGCRRSPAGHADHRRSTRRQIGGLFDLEDLGTKELAGFPEPQPAWRVIGESGAVSRFEALRSGETRSSAVTRKSSCCCVAGNRQRPAKDGWC